VINHTVISFFLNATAQPYGKICSRSAVVTVQRRTPDKQMAEVIAAEEGNANSLPSRYLLTI